MTRRRVEAQTANHKLYLQSIKDNIYTICIGPAGAGKTYMSAGVAANMLLDQKIDKIIITRPAVECGEKLGYLPGDLDDKIGPYVVPVIVSLMDFIHKKELEEFVKKDIIEVVPLAYIKGRTFKKSFVLCDEAEDASFEQLKMLLTRIGIGSKLVVSGDTTQPEVDASGLLECMRLLKDCEDFGIVGLNSDDIMRHPRIRDILEKLENHNLKRQFCKTCGRGRYD